MQHVYCTLYGIPSDLSIMCYVPGGGPGEGDEGGDYEFAAGDSVRVDLDIETAKLMQEGHGGWNEAMTDVNTCMYNDST